MCSQVPVAVRESSPDDVTSEQSHCLPGPGGVQEDPWSEKSCDCESHSKGHILFTRVFDVS